MIIGHDWGAIAGTGLAAMPDGPFTKAVIMSVPPSAAFRRRGGGAAERGRLAAHLVRQVFRSWYIMYFQLPLLPERSASWVLPLLWRRWSPGYRADEDLRHVDAAIGAPASWRAALGPYRATIRNTRPSAQYAQLNQLWTEEPVLPCLYLHGRDDVCMTPAFARWAEKVLPAGSEVGIVEHAGHFLQLEQPDKVADLVLGFIGSPG